MAQPETILTLTYDFLSYLVPELSKYPRDHKFTTGDRIQNLTHDILDDFIIAYYSKISNDKIDRLRKANVKLELLRFAIRLSHVWKLLNNDPEGVKSVSRGQRPRK